MPFQLWEVGKAGRLPTSSPTWKLVRAAQGSSKPPWVAHRPQPRWSLCSPTHSESSQEGALTRWPGGQAKPSSQARHEVASLSWLLIRAWQRCLFQDFISIAAWNPENLEEFLPSLSQPRPQRAINLVIQASLPLLVYCCEHRKCAIKVHGTISRNLTVI